MKLNAIYLFLFTILLFGCKEEKKTVTEVEDDVVTTATFLSLSDVHLDSSIENTKFGSQNDTGNSLWSRTKTKIETVVKDESPKFMVYLGDLPHHEDSMRKTNVKLMLEHLGDLNINIPILYLPGNNDSLGGDYHSFTDSNNDTPFSTDTSYPWPVLHKNTPSTTVTNIDYNKAFGFYSADVNTGGNTVKIIALNTVIFTTKSYAYNSHQITVKGKSEMVGDDGKSQQEATQIQMRWLDNTLTNTKATDRIIMMMHIPPGKDGYGGGPMWNADLNYINKQKDTLNLQNAFLGFIEQKQSNIAGILTGHTHLDGLRRLYKSHHNTTPTDMIGLSISTPGITIGHGNNPAFKTFTYNTSNFDILDFKTYFAVPTQASKSAIAKAKAASSKGSQIVVAPVLDSLFVFRGDSSYTFKESYKAATSSNATIYSTIYNMDKDTIINYMNSIYGAKSDQNVTIKHESALDVHIEE